MSTAFDEPRRTAESRLNELLTDHGLPEQYFGTVVAALRDLIPRSTASLTAAEIDFIRDAGLDPDELFSEQAEERNRLYEAASTVVLDDELQESLISTRQVADLLGKDAAHVRRMLSEGRLLTAGQIGGQSAFPRWQFVGNEPLRHLREVLPAFPADYHPLDIEQVMTTPDEDLGGRSPREWLATGGAVRPVLELVSSLSFS